MPNSDCPVCRTADIVCGKWTLLVIRDLADGRCRFGELERSLEGISPRTLSLRLRSLEEEGIVARQTFPEVPPRVEYELTEKGRALVPIIESMRSYGTEWLGATGSCSEAPEPGPRSTSAIVGRSTPSGLQLRVRARGARPAAQNPPRMHNRALHDTLAAFVEEAAWQLAEEVAAGAEVPFELIEQGRASAPLYCYRPLTDRFIAEHLGMLERLPSYPAARQSLAALPNLGAYLIARGRRAPAGDRRAQGDSALEAFITALWGDATDFVYDRERFAQVYGELEEAVYDGCSLSRRARARRGARDRRRGGRARRRPRARPRRHAAQHADRPARRRLRDDRRPAPRVRARRVARRSSRPAAACAGCRPRCGCGTTPSRRSPRSPGPARTAARGCRCRSPPACAAWTATASSRPRRRTRCARSAP